ncbi:MAG: ATP-binding protein [Planctomycetaceae bacterium]|nr:ATP-binding protein [Planctomycetaceae bacterium]
MSDQWERENAEHIIAQLQEQLLQAQKLTAIGELASTTTHEFNNLLMTIINYAKLGLRHTDDETRTKSFDKILTAANRAAKVTGTILGMARNRRPGFEPTQLKPIIEDALLLLEREMNKYRISVERELHDVPEIMADGNQIQQILVNLFINARQAMPNGGKLKIKLDFDPVNPYVALVVRDDGTGIPTEKLRHIFDAFYTTKAGPDASGKGGTGLGLAACRSIVEAHSGKIRVNSTLGKGTAFTIMFPVRHSLVMPVLSDELSSGIPNEGMVLS